MIEKMSSLLAQLPNTSPAYVKLKEQIDRLEGLGCDWCVATGYVVNKQGDVTACPKCSGGE